jgi:hypothetical protein
MATKQHVDDLGKILKSTTNIHTKAISNSGASEANIKKATEVDKTSISLRTANLGRVTFAAEQAEITNAQRGNNILGFLREGLTRFLISIDISIVLLRSKDITVNDIDLSLAFVNKIKGLYEGMCKTVVAGPATNAKKNLVRDALKALLAEPLPVNVREALRKCVAARVPTNVGYPAYMRNVNIMVNIAWPVAQAPAVQPPVAQPPAVQAPVAQPPAVQAPAVQAPGGLSSSVQAPVAQPPVGLSPSVQSPGGLSPSIESPGGPPPVGQKPNANQGFTEKEKGYFKILGIPTNSSLEKINEAYRKLILENHPNRTTDPEEKRRRHEVSVLINEAKGELEQLFQRRRNGLTPQQQATAATAAAAAEEAAAVAAEQEAEAAAARAQANNNARTRKEAEAAAAEAAAARARANAAAVANVSAKVRANANAIPLLMKNKSPAFTGALQPTSALMSNFAAAAAAATGNLVKGGNISASVPTTAEGLRALIELQDIDKAPQFRTALSDGSRLINKGRNPLTETDKKTLLLFKKYVTYAKEVDVTKPDQLKAKPGTSRKFTAKGNMLIAFGAKGGNDVLQLHPDNLILNDNGFGITGMATHNSGERFIYLEGLTPEQYDIMVSLIGKVKEIVKSKFNPGRFTFGRGAEVYGGRRTKSKAKAKAKTKAKATRRNRRS